MMNDSHDPTPPVPEQQQDGAMIAVTGGRPVI